MRYYLDTEFNGFGGALISLALVPEQGERSLYLYTDCPKPRPWVRDNVLPVIHTGGSPVHVGRRGFGRPVDEFLADDHAPTVIANWPDDIRHFCKVMIQAPNMIFRPRLFAFELVRMPIDGADLPGMVPHNPWWDAKALRHLMARGAAERLPLTEALEPTEHGRL